MSPLALAFLGDAVHTLFVRKHILKNDATVNFYNKLCSHFCSAVFQAKVYDGLELNESEKDIARRARNAKSNNIAKNATIEEYKKATSLEAIIGYNYLCENSERLEYILNLCVKEI